MTRPRNEADKGEQERLKNSRTKYEEIILIEKLYWLVLAFYPLYLPEANSARKLTHLLVCLTIRALVSHTFLDLFSLSSTTEDNMLGFVPVEPAY